MRIQEWFQSWWWPSRIKSLQSRVNTLERRETELEYRLEESDRTVRYAEEESKRMREKWLTATRALEHEKEQAVQQKRERQAIYEQRDEARRLLLAVAGKENVPEWVLNPYDDMEVRMKSETLRA